MHHPRLKLLAEVMGLAPLPERLRQTRVALRGEEDVPATRYDTSSLSQLRPTIGPRLWAGRFVVPRTALITNLFNHTQTPIHEGWSVRKRFVRDFRGRDLTYDSHNGTDFSIPIGTTVVAPAPAKVVRVAREFNRGGLKLFLDHGNGLMTTCVHLARPLVDTGQVVARGQPIALSGYSGLDGVITFPWGTPHVHFNTWLNAVPVDPFPTPGSTSLWRAGELPLPNVDALDDPFEPSVYDPDAVEASIDACKTASSRERIRAYGPLWQRAAALIAELNYYPTRFHEVISPYAEVHARAPVLDLPFRPEDFDGVAFVDAL